MHKYWFSSLIGKLISNYINANDSRALLSSSVFPCSLFLLLPWLSISSRIIPSFCYHAVVVSISLPLSLHIPHRTCQRALHVHSCHKICLRLMKCSRCLHSSKIKGLFLLVLLDERALLNVHHLLHNAILHALLMLSVTLFLGSIFLVESTFSQKFTHLWSIYVW